MEGVKGRRLAQTLKNLPLGVVKDKNAVVFPGRVISHHQEPQPCRIDTGQFFDIDMDGFGVALARNGKEHFVKKARVTKGQLTLKLNVKGRIIAMEKTTHHLFTRQTQQDPYAILFQ